MCSDHPIRELKDYRSVIVLTRCAGPVVMLAPTYRDLRKDVRLFFANSLGVRSAKPLQQNKPNGIKIEGAVIGIMRQVAERG